MWIAFKTLYLWPTDNNSENFIKYFETVVNCFQTLYLWPTDNNRYRPYVKRRNSCELLSNFVSLTYWVTIYTKEGLSRIELWIAFKLCIFDLLITIGTARRRKRLWLWIAFKLCIFDLLITNSSSWLQHVVIVVVNCFQTLYLWPTDNN